MRLLRMDLPCLVCVTFLLGVCSADSRVARSFSDLSTYIGMGCEGGNVEISCGPEGSDKRIYVVRANYGRTQLAPCNQGEDDTSGWNMQCISIRALGRVADMCDGKHRCDVQATNRLFGDPCYLTPKYLEIQFVCDDKRVETTKAPTPIPSTPEPPTTTTTTQTTDRPTTTTPPTTTPVPTTKKPTKPDKPTKPEKPTKPAPPPMLYSTTTERMQGEQPQPATHCPPVTVRGVHWPRHPRGAWAIMDCPNNIKVSRAMWRCGLTPVEWEGKPDLSGCERQELQDLGVKLAQAKELFSSEIITEVSSELQHTSERADLYGGDITAMSHIMDDMVKEVDKQARNTSKPISKRFIQNITDSVLHTSSNMLNTDKVEPWKDLPQATQAETATRVISAVEESAYQAADTYTEPRVVVNVNLNIILEVNVINTRQAFVPDITFPAQTTLGQKPVRSDWLGSGNSIRLSGSSIRDMGIDGLAKVLFLTYNNLEKYLNPEAETRYEASNPATDTYVEVRGRDPETFDPAEIEFESFDPVIETYNVDYEVKPETTSTPATTTTTTTTAATTTTTTEAPAVLNDPPDKNSTRRIVNSQIISASVLQKEKDSLGRDVVKKGHTQLTEPVLYTLEHKTTNNVYNPTCSFWEYSEKTLSGRWSTFGCRVQDTNTTHTTCSCNHITNFAVLMDVQGIELEDNHEFALAFITYLGCVISAVCLLICFLSFTCFKNLQCDRNTIHKNLVLCLLIAEVLFLAGIMQYSHRIVCSVIAAFLHYFFLAAFLWMLLEGIQLYVMLVQVFEAEKSKVKYYYLIAYGTPALIVGISAAIDHTGYGTKNHCWLSAENGFIWAFVGPVVAIISVNIVMLSIAIYQMCRHADAAAAWKMKQKSKRENIRCSFSDEVEMDVNAKILSYTSDGTQFTELTVTYPDISWIKGASVLVVLLGLTWTFGLLYVDQHSLFMAYIFTILNSLQGLFIFIFHCAMNEKVQKEYKRCIRHASWLPEPIRVKYGGAKPYASTSPNQSTSSGNKSQKGSKVSDSKYASLEYLTRLISGRRRKRSSTTTVRSSLSNQTRSGPVYQNMKHDPSRESALLSSPSHDVSDSPAATSGHDDGYLQPVTARHNDRLLSELDHGTVDFSTMEGSCVDTDYYGVDSGAPLDVDKYKIKRDRPPSTDSTDKAALEKERLINDYEEIMPRTHSEAEMNNKLDGYSDYAEVGDRDDGRYDDAILEKKLRQFAEEEQERMNNLNKGDGTDARGQLCVPNITGTTLPRGENAQYAPLPNHSVPDTIAANHGRAEPAKMLHGKVMPTSRC